MPHAVGFNHPRLQDIIHLRRLLEDLYGPSAIVKELIQNADDAGAGQIDFAFVPGIEDSAHPLLRTDALVALNNGPFSTVDQNSILTLGMGAKGGDTSQIGKFGLGMKSVFHLCECVFILASSNQSASNGKPFCVLLNPWHETGRHEDWEDLQTTDESRLYQILDALANDAECWFSLWIPLRKRAQIDSKGHPIVSKFYDQEDPESIIKIEETATYLPFLTSLHRINVWTVDERGEYTCCSSLARSEDAIVSGWRASDTVQTQMPAVIEGDIETRCNEDMGGFNYFGQEIILEDQELLTLMGHTNWPTSAVLDYESGLETDQKEKAVPHAGVIWGVSPSDSHGMLSVSHSVFLPLTEPIQEMRLGTHDRFSVFLHGYFFLDGGRRKILSDIEQFSIQARWNEHLQRKGVAPLVIPSLTAFVDKAGLLVEQIHSLVDAFVKCNWYRKYKETICNNHQGLLSLTPLGPKWKMASSITEVRSLPEPPSETPELPYEIFPGLHDILEEGVLLTCSSWPKLSTTQTSQWAVDDRWLAGIAMGDILARVTSLEFLTDFIKEQRLQFEVPVWKKLIAALTDGLVTVDLAHLISHQNAVNRLIETIPHEYRTSISDKVMKIDRSSECYRSLLKMNLSVLIVPESWLSASEETERVTNLTISDTSSVFKWLASPAGSEILPEISDRTALAIEVLAITEGDRQAQRDRCGGYTLFRIRDLKDNQDSIISWDELETHRSSGYFLTAPNEFVAPLQEALRDIHFFRYTGQRSLDVLFGDGYSRGLGRKTCIDLLNQTPRLREPGCRLRILEMLTEKPSDVSDKQYIDAMRYLLHGQADHHMASETTLLAPGRGSALVWGRLAAIALQKMGEEWRLIPGDLTSRLTATQMETFHVKAVNADTVETLFLETSVEQDIRKLDLTPQEREDVLGNIKDEDLWRLLPLHETIGGEFVPIVEDRTYLMSNHSVPDAITDLVTIIRLPAEPRLIARYKQVLGTWDAEKIIDVCLSQEEPAQFYIEILDALMPAFDQDGSPDILSHLQNTKWVPTRFKSLPVVSPQEILYVEGIEDDIARIVSKPDIDTAYIDVGSVTKNVKNHDAFALIMRRLCPSTVDSMRILGASLIESKLYGVGPLSHEDPDDLIENLVSSTRNISYDAMPGAGLLKSMYDSKVGISFLRQMLTYLAHVVPADSVRTWLPKISERYQEERDKARQHSILNVFCSYLAILVRCRDFSIDLLGGLYLLDRKLRWTPIEQLTLQGDVAGQFLIHAELVDVLKDIFNKTLKAVDQEEEPPQSNPLDEVESLQLSVSRLKGYFGTWDGHVASPTIGGLLALLGEPMEDLATGYLQPRHSALGIRTRLLQGNVSDSNKFHFVVKIHDVAAEELLAVYNTLGESFSAVIRDDFNNLLIKESRGSLNVPVRYGTKTIQARSITVRYIDPATRTRMELTELIRETARVILDDVYFVHPEQVDAVWKELSENEQLDLDVAQQMILQHAFFYLKVLHSKDLDRVRDLYKAYDKYRRHRAEMNRDPDRGGKSNYDFVQLEEVRLNKAMKGLLESDKEAQASLLSAVRNRIEEAQYNCQSIPFELFQNADDAAKELVEISSEDTLPQSIDRMVCIQDDRKITFIHWGRPINACKNFEEDQNRGFHQDLEKMLVLSSSDKDGESITGKFGLGFKSVFLYADQPIVLSGQLGFRVVAGFFPERLSPKERKRLKQFVEPHDSNHRDIATLIELNGAGETDADEVMASFRKQIHVMLVFARRIKRFDWHSDQIIKYSRWTETKVEDADHLYFGRLIDLDESEPASGALVIRIGESEAILFSMDRHGFSKLPDHIPTIWVTAPTQDTLRTGFAVNAPFSIDVGRAQIARDPEANKKIVVKLSHGFAQAFKELAQLARDFPSLCNLLDLTPDTEPYTFWSSFWNLVTADTLRQENPQYSVSVRLLRDILWSETGAMSEMIKRHPVLPSQLPGSHRILTSLSRVIHETTGIIDNEAWFSAATSLSSFSNKVRPGTVVSHARVGMCLRQLMDVRDKQEAVTLKDAIRWEIEDWPDVSEKEASRLGELVNPDAINALKYIGKYTDEVAELEAWLADLRFPTQAGKNHLPAGELLVADGPKIADEDRRDELMRAAFAPEARKLVVGWSQTAMNFFLACRQSMSAGAEILYSWGTAVTTASKRTAFLRYVLSGRLNVAQYVHEDSAYTWIDEVATSPYLEGFTEDDRRIVLSKLGLWKQDQEYPIGSWPEDPEEELDDEAPVADPKEVLHNIYAWWAEDGQKRLMAYDEETYPDAKGLFEDISIYYEEKTRQREAWLTLLLRGTIETIGRTKPGQQKGFLAFLERNEWIRKLADQHTDSTAIVELIKDYLESSIDTLEYFQWVKEYIPLAVLSKWLDEYVPGLLYCNDIKRDFSIKRIFNPRANPDFSRGGYDGPPLGPVLGIGAHFVLRELTRKEVLNNRFLYPLCYHPVNGVRQIMARLGMPDAELRETNNENVSRSIHLYLVDQLDVERAHFDMAFDIPLITIWRTPELRQRFLSEV